MAEYRNSIKNKENIKKAFAELVAEKKDISKITIKEIADKADISKSTFYSHYEDIYALLADFQNEILKILDDSINEYLDDDDFTNYQPLLDKCNHFIKENEGFYKQLYLYTGSDDFLKKVRKLMVNKLEKKFIKTNDTAEAKTIYFHINLLVNGLVYMIADYYSDEDPYLTQDEIIKIAFKFLGQLTQLAKVNYEH